MTVVVKAQAVADRVVGGRLQGGVQRGGDVVALGQRFRSEARDHVLAHHLGDVRGVHLHRPLMRFGMHGLGLGLRGFGRGDVTVLAHPLHHIGAALLVAAGVADRVAAGGKLQRAHQRGGLGQGQLVQGLAVVVLGRGGHAVGAVAEEALVEVQLQDLVLGQHLLDADGQHHLHQLAGVAVLRAQEPLPGHLLGDGAAAGHAALLPADDLPHGPGDAGGVDARVLVELAVLGGDEGLLDPGRNLVDLHRITPDLPVQAHQPAVAGIDIEGFLQLHVPQGLDVRDLGRDRVVQHPQADGAGQGKYQERDEGPTEKTTETGHPVLSDCRIRNGRV